MIDDVIPAKRPITVADLLRSTAGYGFASDFSRPAVTDTGFCVPAAKRHRFTSYYRADGGGDRRLLTGAYR
jgi:hypothetical protein